MGWHDGPVIAPPRQGITRRRVLIGLLLAPPALSACSLPGGAAEPPDPLVALADAARADAALGAAAIKATTTLAERLRPLVDARAQHAVALDGEVARRDPARASTTARPAAGAPADGAPAAPVSLEQVRAAVLASGQAAGAVALVQPAERIGLVASVAACCSAYAVALS